MRKEILIGTLAFSLLTPALTNDEAYTIGLEKYKGIDVLNFYEAVPEQNKYITYFDAEFSKDFNLYQWKMAEGYVEINELWDLEYSIEREYYDLKGNGKNFRKWDNLIQGVRPLQDTTLFDRNWTNSFVVGIQQEQSDSTFEIEKYELFLGYRSRTNLDFGMGGTYFGYDVIGKKVLSIDEDGYGLEFNLVSFSNLGYGFQFINLLSNEYAQYDDFDGTYHLDFESYLKWTYELGYNWAFCTKLGIQIDKYFMNTPTDYSYEIDFYPHFLYNYEIFEDFRIFGEIGLPSYEITKTSGKTFNDSNNRFYFYTKIGIEYIF